MKREGGWMFISHSHQDIEAVRKIRNLFEALGFEPLMFFLKCLNDDDEIESLIKREIDERQWFVYVDSENARRSRWVQSERAYIRSLAGKKVLPLDIRDSADGQLSAAVMARIEELARSLKVFVSYAADDRETAAAITRALVRRDLQVLSEELTAGPTRIPWRQEVAGAIKTAAREGVFLLLLSEAAAASRDVERELLAAEAEGGVVLPVLLGDPALTPALRCCLGCRQMLRVSAVPTAGELERIIGAIERTVPYVPAEAAGE